MVFDALATGPEDGELVLLLHGFPQTGFSYRHQLRALGEAGYYAVAPDQRGYSPGARPEEIEAYGMVHLVGDVVRMAAALGRERFHLVGHDWGGAVAWATATYQPQRVLTLVVLSTPHFGAMSRALADPESEQYRRSAYFEDFAAPDSELGFLADDAARLRDILAGTGSSPEEIDVYLERLGDRETMRAALNWYRALQASRAPPPPAATGDGGAPRATGAPAGPRVAAPTLYIWGTEDVAFSRDAVEATAEYVGGPYALHEIEGAGHWLPEEEAETVTRLLLEHLRRQPAKRASVSARLPFLQMASAPSRSP